VTYEMLRDVAISADVEGNLPVSFFAEKLGCAVSEVEECVAENYNRIPCDIVEEEINISFYYAVTEARDEC
jgi:hypothetical protein